MKKINPTLIFCVFLINTIVGIQELHAQNIIIGRGGVLTVNARVVINGPGKIHVKDRGLLTSSIGGNGSITGSGGFEGIVVDPTPVSNPNTAYAVKLEGMTINGAEKGLYSTGVTGEFNQKIFMKDITFNNNNQHVEFSHDPINMTSINPIDILDCTFNQNGHIWPFWFKHAKNVTIANCLFDFPSSNIIVHARATNKLLISGCTFIGQTVRGVDMHGLASTDVTITNNDFLGCSAYTGLIVVGGMVPGTINDLKMGLNSYCSSQTIFAIGAGGGTYILGPPTGPDNINFGCRIGGSVDESGEYLVKEPKNSSTERPTPALVNIYPNPNNGQFRVDIEDGEATASIEVFDFMGKKVFDKTSSGNKFIIDITDQARGIYFVKVTIGDEVFNEKIVKN